MAKILMEMNCNLKNLGQLFKVKHLCYRKMTKNQPGFVFPVLESLLDIFLCLICN